jgi:hypothetical protein
MHEYIITLLAYKVKKAAQVLAAVFINMEVTKVCDF